MTFIGDVRGKGLLMAFEMMADRDSKAPLPKVLNAHSRLVEQAYARGLILYSRRTRGGYEGDHFIVCAAAHRHRGADRRDDGHPCRRARHLRA
jgi:adenosylmethionine-8-amino-7-oxononanoate aminotransferase